MIQIVSRVNYDILKAVADGGRFGLHDYAYKPWYLPRWLRHRLMNKLIDRGLIERKVETNYSMEGWPTITDAGKSEIEAYEDVECPVYEDDDSVTLTFEDTPEPYLNERQQFEKKYPEIFL